MAKPKRHRPIRAAAQLSRAPHPSDDPGMCLRQTRNLYDIPASAPDAIGAWQAAKHKHRTSTWTELPPGVPIFWSGGSAGHGHVAIAAVKRGYCWSVDINRPGYWDRVPIARIHDDWGLTWLGWTEDLNGVQIGLPHYGKHDDNPKN